MKSFFLILTSFLVLTACTVPGPSDFESTEKPLGDDEFIVIWRFSRLAKDPEVLDKSPEHKVEMEAAMAPLFEQLIPQIFSDIKEGKLLMREEDDITDLDENPIKNLPALMELFYETSWQNFKPFMEVFHITQRRNAFTAGFPAVELELELIGQDPNGKYHESGLGSVRVDDLIKLGYSIEVEGQKYELIDYLNKTIKFGYPISYFYKNNENGLRTLEEAFGTKKLLLEGEFMSISWIAGEPNLTGKKSVSLPISKLKQYAGDYFFQSKQGSFFTQGESDEPVIVSIMVSDNSSATNDYYFYRGESYLRINGSENIPSTNLFPTNEQSFFTTSDELINFEKIENGRMKITLIDSEGREAVGYRD